MSTKKSNTPRPESLNPARFNLAAIAVTKDGCAVAIVAGSYWELETAWKKICPKVIFNPELVQQVRILPPETNSSHG